MLADIIEQHSACVALKMCYDTLLVARSIDFACGLSVQPDAAFALIGITVATQLCVVEPIELWIFDVQSRLQVTYAETFLAYFAYGRLATVCLLCLIESGTDMELAVGSKRDVVPACIAVVHLVEHHAIGEQIQLWRFSLHIKFLYLCGKRGQHVFVYLKVIILKTLNVRDDYVQTAHLPNNGHQETVSVKQIRFGCTKNV